MLIYVAHTDLTQADIANAEKRVVHLQKNHPENCYVCPIFAFSPILRVVSGKQYELIRQDLLSACDQLIAYDPFDEAVKSDIKCAEKIGLEIKVVAKKS